MFYESVSKLMNKQLRSEQRNALCLLLLVSSNSILY